MAPVQKNVKTGLVTTSQSQVPKLTKDKYDIWCIQIKALLESLDVWELIRDGYSKPNMVEESRLEKNEIHYYKKRRWQLFKTATIVQKISTIVYGSSYLIAAVVAIAASLRQQFL